MLNLETKMMDDQPRVVPDRLARALGLNGSDKLNCVIAKNINELLKIDRVHNFSSRGDGGVPKHWLTEKQAFFIATRVDTPAAQDFLVHMIKTVAPLMRGARHA